MNGLKTAFVTLLMAGSLALPRAGAQVKDSPALDLARQLNQAFIEVADQVSPAVVVIDVDVKAGKSVTQDMWDMLPPQLRKRFENRSPRTHASASGIVITEDGYILTNNHVVEDAEKITVRFKDGKQFDAEVKGTDPESDVAVIKVKASGLKTAKLGDSDKTRVGEFAIAIGAPFGDLDYSVTVGHVSAKGRSFEKFNHNYSDQDFLQTDARINPGNSGGPLVNLYGEVIGINSMIRGDSGIGFAIPINLAIRVKEHIIADGKFVRSWIGVGITDFQKDTRYRTLDPSLLPDAEDGVWIDEVAPNGPAAKSKLRPADLVVGVDGKPVKTSRQFKDLISTAKVGDTVSLDVIRGKKHVTVKIKTEALPGEETAAKSDQKASPEVAAAPFGLSVQTLTAELAGQLGVEATTGVAVTEVQPDSTADGAGIKPGDVITEVNRKPVANIKEFRDAIKTADSKRGVMLILVSEGASKLVVLKDGE